MNSKTANSPTARRFRIGKVARVRALSPNMQRVTFTGPDLLGFPEDRNGGNIKLFFPNPGSTPAHLCQALEDGDRPTTRTFTARRYTAPTNELHVDFVLHAGGGPATTWAARAKPGDFLGIAGPSGKKLVAADADWFLFCVDMSAMPAALAAIEDLPQHAEGQAFFEVPSTGDRRDIKAPPKMQLTWLINEDPLTVSTHQHDALRAIDWRPERVSVFAAGETNAVRKLRQFICQEKHVPREDCYLSGYWKLGLIEDEHQRQKRKEPSI